MTRLYQFIIIIFVIAGVDCMSIQAETSLENDSIRFENWTDEQFRNYEDSIYAALYPPVIIQHTDSQDIDIPVIPVFPSPVSPVPESVAIDKTKEVGQIPIMSGTSPSGAKTYEVPVSVYPGINDFQPNLALVYNSQQGNSILGRGWSIAGLSAITRGNRTMYYDNTTQGIVMNNSDSFFLDGVRLIKLSQNDDYILYESESGNVKVKGHISGDILKYFEVFYPNGNRGVFGYMSSTGNKLTYPLNYVTDLYNNSINYTYQNSGNCYCITKISYGRCSVEFQYTANRQDQILLYSGGTKVYDNKLLSSITCKLNAQVLGIYNLNYSNNDDFSLLTSIGYSSNEKSYNPLNFYYGEGISPDLFSAKYTRLIEWYKPENSGEIKIVKGKFNYNSGDDGIISLPNRNPYWVCFRTIANALGLKSIFENKYKSDENIYIYSGLNQDWATPVPNLKTEKGFIDLLCADLSGSQNEDIIKINNLFDGNADKVTFKVYHTSASLGLVNLYSRSFSLPTEDKSIKPKFYYTGDFNGDGKMEILAISAHEPFGGTGNPSKCYIFDLVGNQILFDEHIFPYNVEFVGSNQTDAQKAINNSDRFFVFDYDGDGKTDLCHINETGINIYTFTDINGILTPHKVATNDILKKSDLVNCKIFVGEFNGDGLMDLLVSPSHETDSRDWSIYNSKGDGHFEKNVVECVVNTDDVNSGFVLQDMDGDGTTDLVQYDVDDFITYFARNNSFTCGVRSFQNIKYSIPVPANVNSRNSFNQLICLKDGVITRYSYNRNSIKATLMTGVSNSLGVIEKNDYKFLNPEDNSGGFFSSDNDAVFPYVNIHEPMPVITRSEVFVNGQSVNYNDYTYYNAVVHRHGKGFCGFKNITTVNKRGQTYVRKFDPYNFGLLKSEVSPKYNKEYTYTVNIQPNKIVKNNLTHKSEKNLLSGILAITSYQYDSYGYPVQEQISYSDGLNVTRTNTYSSSPDVQTGYNLGFLTDQSATITRNNDSYTERVFITEHNKRLPLTTLYFKNGNQIKQKTHTYDLHGNVLTETTLAYSSQNTQTTTNTYDAYGRLKKTVDPLGRSNGYTYNRLGQLSATIDARGNSTTFEYDSFGRETSVINPDGTVKTTGYSWVDESVPGVYAVTESATGSPTVKNNYDALNRLVRSVETRFDGTEVNVDRRYDTYGNLSKLSRPFSGSSVTAWNVYDYDSFNRIKSLKKASGQITSYEYHSNSSAVTVTRNGVSTTKDYDAEGNLISVTDPNGTICYEIAADGQTASICVNDDIITNFSYDIYRRQTSTTDPSKGTTTYTYDSAGNIETETNANGQVIMYEYDVYDRLVKTTTPEFKTVYNYNEYNDITSVSSDNGTAKEFVYDGYGRINSVKEFAVDGKWLKKDYSYADGNVSAVKYTSHLGVLATENNYYSNGRLSDIKLNGRTSIYKLIKENVFGQPTEISTGNVNRGYTYTDHGLPAGRTAATASATVQDFSYTFDPHKSNLLSRRDNTRNLTENFDYDEFDRLTAYGNETVAYDAKGNITEKSDVGTFEYAHPVKPYAVTDVLPVGDAIPESTQNISYTSFLRPERVEENNVTALFSYNSSYDRVKMDVSEGNEKLFTRYYLGNCYELEVTDNCHKETLYLGGDYYSAPAALVKYSLFAETGPVGDDSAYGLNTMDVDVPSAGFDDSGQEFPNSELYFIVRDYLGSITHIISAYDGKIVQELSYDAWGRLRNPSTCQTYASGSEPTLFLGRGFTGHEHLPWFGLINMNARLYDPVLGRFLSPDPFVQNMDWLQNYNRYSYALNNPLCYIDEDGQFFWVAVGVAAAIGGVINVATHWSEIRAAGGWNAVLKGAAYFGAGAVAGGVGAAVSIGAAVGFGSMMGLSSVVATSGFVSGVSSGAAGGAAGGFLSEVSNSLIEGEGFDSALKRGFTGAISGAVFGGIMNGTISGIKAYRNGRDFWTGKYTIKGLLTNAAEKVTIQRKQRA